MEDAEKIKNDVENFPAKKLSLFLTNDIREKSGITKEEPVLDPLVSSLEYDSRGVKKDSLFFALPGLHTDGSVYINDAVKNGASVIAHENEIADNEKIDGVVYLKAKNCRFAMSPVCDSFYDFPSRRLLVTGVTGTEGKSTTVYLIWQLLTFLGKKTGFISTVQHCMGDAVLWNPEHQTTPEAPVTQKLLRRMADNGCEHAVLESSSHGLSVKTNRLGDVNYCCGVLTNITHEHLEFHGTWEQYRDDKTNLFRALDNFRNVAGAALREPFGVINADDKSASYVSKATKRKTLSFSASGKDGDIILKSIESGADGNWYSVFIPALNERVEIRDKLPGAFNAANVLAALLTVSGLLSVPVSEIAGFVKDLKPVKGRMSSVKAGQPFEVVIDYAHTPSSFSAIFPPLRERLDKKKGKIISVFGSPGERDTLKRSEQGKTAALYSDIIILTDEDPRGDDPMEILEEIALGVLAADGKTVFKKAAFSDSDARRQPSRDENLFLIPDRPSAIRLAFTLAKDNDLVILLGKSHENSIIYKDYIIPFDEFKEAEKALAEMGYKK
ncbi:MAG: UDP-N-acetylmuramoyl-L-alanyl-D-glutamate--2,6-diaminopimelate ligase [Treponema sp.]|nr:UDP-N-acetylmuramoyl-L-alanyl-D-glutamate--2,6-diaminopimelate ligase [Treponema sp.]